MINSGVYIIKNLITNVVYVGSAVNIEKRLWVHKNSLIKNKHVNKYLQNAWNKYGESNFKFIPILYCKEKLRLIEEQTAIDNYKSLTGVYNLYPFAGTPLGSKHSEITKKKQSEKRKMFWKNAKKPYGSSNPFFGKTHSIETKQKISDANKGKLVGNKHALNNQFKHTPEEIEKMKSFWTEERKIEQSKKLKGCIPWNKGLKGTYHTGTSGMKGKCHSEQTKRKMSESVKKYLANPENREQRSISAKKGWINRKRKLIVNVN